jgi:hypothetical protein
MSGVMGTTATVDRLETKCLLIIPTLSTEVVGMLSALL